MHILKVELKKNYRMMTHINKTMPITFILEEIQDRLDYLPDLIIFHTVFFILYNLLQNLFQ